jgi:hypothetical protein
METKANPNPNGCLARSMPDEPRFTLLGRDLEAPKAIRQWTLLRIEAGQQADDPQILEALADAASFERWRSDNLGAWRDYKPAPEPDLIPTPSDEISSAAGRILASGDLFRDRKLIRQFSQQIADAGVIRPVVDGQQPTDDLFGDALSAAFGRILEDAKKLAGFAMRSDRQAGHNE